MLEFNTVYKPNIWVIFRCNSLIIFFNMYVDPSLTFFLLVPTKKVRMKKVNRSFQLERIGQSPRCLLRVLTPPGARWLGPIHRLLLSRDPFQKDDGENFSHYFLFYFGLFFFLPEKKTFNAQNIDRDRSIDRYRVNFPFGIFPFPANGSESRIFFRTVADSSALRIATSALPTAGS